MIFHKQGEFIFPIADGRIKTSGGDQDLTTSTLIRHRPIQGESHVDFLGESEGSLPPPLHDSFPDAGEAINYFWSMPGNFIYRHHVEPRVKLYSPREESFPIPLKYIDVSRTTHTNLDVKQEKRIDDYWNIDGSRDLSDSWTGFTQFTLLEEKPPEGFMWSGGRWPGGWGPQGRSPTGGGGLARVPSLRVCKHPTPTGWHTQGGKDELTSCRGTVQSAWQKTSSETQRRKSLAARKRKWPPRGTGTTVLTYPGSAPRGTGKAGENGQNSG